jgi:hypothetical protein
MFLWLALLLLLLLLLLLGREGGRGDRGSIALCYRLDDQGSRVQFLVEPGNFSLHNCVQNNSGAYPASYPMGTRDSFCGGKAAGA